MKRISLHRKTRFGSSKGVSTVIATVFLVLTVFVLSTNVFLWTLSQNALYNQAAKDTNQRNADRMNENVIAEEGNCTWYSANKVKVQAKLTNAGSIAAQIINLWVFDTSKQTYGFNNSIASLSGSNMNPGQVLNLTGSNAMIVNVPNAVSGDKFNAWFVTARGNTVPVVTSRGIIIAEVSQGIGSVGMDFGAFIYYNVSGSSPNFNLQVWPNGKEGFNVPDADIAFRVTLTNFDMNQRTINLTSHSALWMNFPTFNPQQSRSAWWYIVDVDDTGKIKSTFSVISLPYGVPTKVYFASFSDLGKTGFSRSSPGNKGPAAVNLMVFGTIGTSTLGQNIPFVSVYVT